MELILPQRKIVFEGMELTIPHDTLFITIDSNGFIQAHGSRPWSEVTFWEGEGELGIVGVVSEEEGCRWMNAKDPVFVGPDGDVIL